MAQPSLRLTIRIPGSGTMGHLATQQGISRHVSPSKKNAPLGGRDVVHSHCVSLAPEKGKLDPRHSSSVLQAADKDNLNDEEFYTW